MVHSLHLGGAGTEPTLTTSSYTADFTVPICTFSQSMMSSLHEFSKMYNLHASNDEKYLQPTGQGGRSQKDMQLDCRDTVDLVPMIQLEDSSQQ
jgi:hypothetical protein